MTPEQVMTIARRVCTADELEALDMRERLKAAGREHGYRSVAAMLGRADRWTTVRDTIKRAEARVLRALNEGAEA